MGTDVDAFLAAAMPPLNQAELALHNGDAAPRIAMWSHNDPVTLFGAASSATGWAEIGPLFERLGSFFSNCTSSQNQVVAAGASGDLAYIVAFEHTTASINGAPPQPYVLRATTVFRREDGEWKVVHRHADPASETAGALTAGALTAGALTAGALTAGALTAGALTAGALTAGALTAGALTAGALTAGALTAGALTAGALTAGALTAGALAERIASTSIR